MGQLVPAAAAQFAAEGPLIEAQGLSQFILLSSNLTSYGCDLLAEVIKRPVILESALRHRDQVSPCCHPVYSKPTLFSQFVATVVTLWPLTTCAWSCWLT
jgi:hypothetical protein